MTDDVYLARIYVAALGPLPRSHVARRNRPEAEDHSRDLRDAERRGAGARAEVLEIAIILLIVFEIVLSLTR